jgi:LacI family transcriptional regulator
MTLQKPTPKLQDVAKKSGVSTATVSRTLNFPDQVAEATRAKIMAVVQELGYSPNFAARAMAAQRTNTIGAVIPTMENAIFARGLQAFEEALQEQGFTLLVATSFYQPAREEAQIRSLVARGADGLLLIGHARDSRIYQFLETQGVPALVSWALDNGAGAAAVGFDNHKAMSSLAQEVLRLGHRRIAMISAETDGNDRAAARLAAVRDAMEAGGLSGQALAVVETPYGINNGAQAFERLMSAPLPPTAILCGNDVLAVGALRRAREMGIDVPGDVSITGFDDIELAQLAVPALTTVHVPHREMGRKAAHALIEMVKTGMKALPVELPVELRLRDSLGPPRA